MYGPCKTCIAWLVTEPELFAIGFAVALTPPTSALAGKFGCREVLQLLGKRTCCVCYASDGGYSLYESLVGHPWSLVTLYELKRLSWSRYRKLSLVVEVQVVEG